MRTSNDLSVMNAMEPIVVNLFEDHFLKSQTLECDCDKCRLDILLYTLNQLPPRYTSSQAGEAYIKALYMNPQLQSDILTALTQAVRIVADRPSHP